ncbi:metallophosphoesterase family protein [Pseudodesulfovibrio portus]|uniref:Phosphoesterase n=1 Tax=Pseudodesulfovibrio portus TaxID=231439 RepID=A0ABM8ASV7_9BACT|nr:metallophosphoesterase [Pseudodesulfovibrio portus]BDQ34554.1 phosphoesterase [Pseudodesulfovibrio portus]
MPRIAIMSDIHGNFEALKEVFRDLDKRDVTETYCLGDMVGYGPQPRECVDLLRERGVECTMGNHEQGLINIHYLRRFNQPAADALRWTREAIDRETYDWLTSRHKSIVAHGCRMVHGMPPDSVNEYLWRHRHRMAEVFADFAEPICFVGHTHDLKRYVHRGGVCEERPLEVGATELEPDCRHLINVGAVGQPRDGDNRAKYLIFDTDKKVIDLHAVPYDIRKTADLIAHSGLHRGFADRLW